MTWTDLHAQIHRTMRSRGLFQRNQRLLVAVSGGQDSLCLMKLLLDLQPKWGWNLGVCHCDHRWREDSQKNAHHVENLAKSWQVPFYLETASEVINSEAAARNWRYKVLSAVAREYEYDCVVTGHTASDRAETLLYNLIRGTGADGLQALTWQRLLDENIFLIRPLLEITRSQTKEFCQKFSLPIWEDSTNQDLKYARNHIRNEIIPYLRQNFNPQIEFNLAQTAELLQAEVEYLEQIAEEILQEAVGKNSIFTLPLSINRKVLQKVPLALQRRVMRQILQQILSCGSSFEHIQKLTNLITAPNRSQTDPFPGGIIAQVEGDWISIRS